MKEFFSNVFYNPGCKKFVLVNNFYAALTIVSILAIILETLPSLSQYKHFFDLIEYVSLFLFSVEYFGRLIGAHKARTYIFSFFGIIDLISVLPTFLGLGNLSALKSARVLRIIRLLRTMRLLKVTKGHLEDEKDIRKLTILNFEIYFVSLISAIIISASLIHVIEPDNILFTTIPHAMLWSSKVILGSLGATQPLTLAGQLIMIFSRFVGLLLFGLLITVVGSTIKRVIFGSSKRGFE